MLFILIALSISVYVFSQTEEQEESMDTIDIPDVSTTIGGIEVPVDKNAIPNFTLILPESEPDFLLSIELPNADLSESNMASDDSTDEEITPSVIALEGIIGGGYPGYFLGEFSVFQNTGKDPFEIRFSHESQNGFVSQPSSQGYNKTDTSIYGQATINFAKKYSLSGSAWYDTGTVGLQGKSPLFYLASHHFGGAKLSFDIALSDFWNLDFHADADFANRYLGFITPPTVNIPTDFDVFTTNSGFSLDWAPDFMNFYFDGAYRYSHLESQNVFTNHRVNFDLGASVPIKDIVTLSAQIDLVYSKNLSIPVLIPFNISADFTQPFMNLFLSGGMKTEQTNIAYLQKRYPFVHLPNVLYEQAEWFVQLDATIPFLKNFTFASNLNFENTAFDHGRLLPNYEAPNVATGMYDSSVQNLLIFDSDLSVSGEFGMFGFSLGWDAAWIDVLPEENAHEAYLVGSIVSSQGLWGVQLGITEAFSGDYIPDINFSAFYNIAPSFQLELKLKDVVKLFSGKDRTYAGHFATDSGYIALFAKLYF